MKHSTLTYISALILVFTMTHCAKRGRPTGGEKDTQAPIMLSATPSNQTTHFKTNKIKIIFDEYIKVKDINTQLIISPPLKHKPIIYPQGSASKYITIKILDTLLPHTTYTFNFGNSIVDNNQENPYKQFMYVFSTGDYLDSLSVKGTVKDAFKQKTDENITIMLYDKEGYYDSIVYKEKPKYLTNTLDSIGFEIAHIKKGAYKLIALKDNNNNFLYEPKADKIGFVEGFITVLTDSIPTQKLKLFKEELPFKLLKPIAINKGKIIFPFEGKPNNLSVKLVNEIPNKFNSFQALEKGKDTLNYWFSEIKKDSLVFEITSGKQKKKVSVKLRSKIKDSLIINKISKNTLHYIKDTFSLSSSLPIEKIDTSKIMITDKDTLAVNFHSEMSLDKQTIKLVFKRKQNQTYTVAMLPAAITSFFMQVNDSLNYRIKTKSVESYGNLALKLENVKSYPFIIELLTIKGELVESKYITAKKEVVFSLLEPKTYKVRLMYDTDKNKKWSTGSFLNNTQPEDIIYYPNEIDIRANWDHNEVFNLK